MVGTDTEFIGGAHHALRLDAPHFTALDLEASGQRGALDGGGDLVPHAHIGSATNDLKGGGLADVGLTHDEVVGIGMWFDRLDLSDNDIAEVGTDSFDGLDFQAEHGKFVGKPVDIAIDIDEFA
jgi:hypothetical protein